MRYAAACWLLALPFVMPIAATAQDATGLWRTEATQEGYLEVQIAPCGAELCGTILRARDLQGHETTLSPCWQMDDPEHGTNWGGSEQLG